MKRLQFYGLSAVLALQMLTLICLPLAVAYLESEVGPLTWLRRSDDMTGDMTALGTSAVLAGVIDALLGLMNVIYIAELDLAIRKAEEIKAASTVDQYSFLRTIICLGAVLLLCAPLVYVALMEFVTWNDKYNLPFGMFACILAGSGFFAVLLSLCGFDAATGR